MSERCSWCKVRQKSTYCSSRGEVEVASHRPLRHQQFQPQNQSTCTLPSESPRCSRKGLASADRTEAGNGNSDRLPQKRRLPGRSVCRAGPGAGHYLQTKKKPVQERLAERRPLTVVCQEPAVCDYSTEQLVLFFRLIQLNHFSLERQCTTSKRHCVANVRLIPSASKRSGDIYQAK